MFPSSQFIFCRHKGLLKNPVSLGTVLLFLVFTTLVLLKNPAHCKNDNLSTLTYTLHIVKLALYSQKYVDI